MGDGWQVDGIHQGICLMYLVFLFVFYFSVYVKFIDKVRKGTSVLTNEALIGLHVDFRLFRVCWYDFFLTQWNEVTCHFLTWNLWNPHQTAEVRISPIKMGLIRVKNAVKSAARVLKSAAKISADPATDFSNYKICRMNIWLFYRQTLVDFGAHMWAGFHRHVAAGECKLNLMSNCTSFFNYPANCCL